MLRNIKGRSPDVTMRSSDLSAGAQDGGGEPSFVLIVMQGFMMKKKSAKNARSAYVILRRSLGHKWVRRWVVLQRDGRLVYYRERPTTATTANWTPDGVICESIDRCRIDRGRDGADSVDKASYIGNSFFISVPLSSRGGHRNTLLVTKGPEDHAQWIRAFRKTKASMGDSLRDLSRYFSIACNSYTDILTSAPELDRRAAIPYQAARAGEVTEAQGEPLVEKSADLSSGKEKIIHERSDHSTFVDSATAATPDDPRGAAREAAFERRASPILRGRSASEDEDETAGGTAKEEGVVAVRAARASEESADERRVEQAWMAVEHLETFLYEQLEKEREAAELQRRKAEDDARSAERDAEQERAIADQKAEIRRLQECLARRMEHEATVPKPWQSTADKQETTNEMREERRLPVSRAGENPDAHHEKTVPTPQHDTTDERGTTNQGREEQREPVRRAGETTDTLVNEALDVIRRNDNAPIHNPGPDKERVQECLRGDWQSTKK